MKIYTQLTQEQRYQIYTFMKAEHNQTEIARQINVDKSTISREVRRNRGMKGYRPKQAHQFSLNRRKKSKYRIEASTWTLIESLLRKERIMNGLLVTFVQTSILLIPIHPGNEPLTKT